MEIVQGNSHGIYLYCEALLSPFVPNAPFLYLPKTSENRKVFFLMFSGGKERVHREKNGLTHYDSQNKTRFPSVTRSTFTSAEVST